MKKLLILLMLCIAGAVQAQSDLTVDSIVWNQTTHIYQFNAGANQLYCPYDPELLHPGLNVTITANLVLANMGPGSAHMGIGNVTPGVVWDSCRGYNYYYYFCEFFLKDQCGVELFASSKAMYDVASGQRYMSSGDVNYAERLAWLSTYGYVDVNYLNNTLDSGGTSDVAPILYPGFRDVYGSSQYGNWLQLPLDMLVVGHTYFYGVELYPFFLNEGANVFPNETYSSFTWLGWNTVTSQYEIAMSNLTMPEETVLPTAVTTTKVVNRTITWSGATNTNTYTVQRKLVAGNTEQGSGTLKTVTGNTYVDTEALPNQNGTFYRWYITAINCAGTSATVGTKKAKVN